MSANPFLAPILARGAANPEAIFAVLNDGEDWREVRQAEFLTLAARFAGLLRREGIGAGKIVLIVSHHRIEAFAAFLGAMLAGAVPSFMPHPSAKQDVGLYWRQHREIFSHIRPAAILAEDAYRHEIAAAASDAAARVIPLSAGQAAEPDRAPPLPDADAVCLLQHSSGTTGLKKGVMLSFRAVCAQLAAYGAALGMEGVPHARIASWLPLYHDMGLITSFLLPMWMGLPIVTIDPFEWTARPSLFFEAIQSYRATHAWLPNFAFLHQVRTARPRDAFDLGSVEALISCSEPCKPEAFDAFFARFEGWGLKPSALQTCYAMAETVFAATQSRPGAPVRRLAVDHRAIHELGAVRAPASAEAGQTLLSNGSALDGCDIAILGEAGFLAERAIGEICVKAPYLFSGYFHNPEATKAAFHDGWYRTGDLGFLDAGEVFIVGRLKDIVIVNGKNIFAHDVEACVSRVPGVKPGRAAAFGHYAEALGSEQLIVVAERNEGGADEAGVRAAINRAVFDEVGIACGDIRLVEQGWLAKTTSGKMSRSENRKKYASMLASAPAPA